MFFISNQCSPTCKLHYCLQMTSKEQLPGDFFGPVNCKVLKRDDLACKRLGDIRPTYKAGSALDLSVLVILTWRKNTLTMVMTWDPHQ